MIVMDANTFEKTIQKMTHKIGMISYFVTMFKTELKKLSKDQFSSFLCSGIVPILVSWLENEVFNKKDGDVTMEHARKFLKDHLPYYS